MCSSECFTSNKPGENRQVCTGTLSCQVRRNTAVLTHFHQVTAGKLLLFIGNVFIEISAVSKVGHLSLMGIHSWD